MYRTRTPKMTRELAEMSNFYDIAVRGIDGTPDLLGKLRDDDVRRDQL